MPILRHLTEGRVAAVLEPLLLLAVVLLVAWHLVAGTAASRNSVGGDVRGLRRGSLVAALGTVLLVGGCSATGLENARGTGYQLMLGQPNTYAVTVIFLVGPLLVSLAAPALLTVGRLSARRTSLIVIACWLGAAMAPITSYAGCVTSYAVYCTSRPATAAGDATCAASTGALAAIWGIFGVVAMLPFAVRLQGRIAKHGR